ncbi:hypothetical protein C8R47DRAFT_1228129 [Mycena vitilis]|nr:hypothetical protein C8R47DRAFT_1228129 [Mycena vitilis]
MAKSKEMFAPYNESLVPARMPFPDVGSVHSTKSGNIGVPRLNDYQRSWIFDVALRGVDLPALKGPAARKFYDKVKIDAFSAKAFQHTPHPEDAEEEARVPRLVAAWLLAHPKKSKNQSAADGGDASDEEEDEGGHNGHLRGYTKAGWRRSIQKVISNKRTAENAKSKGKKAEAATPIPVAPAAAVTKLLGIAAYSGRDKFRADRHAEIDTYSKTIDGGNAGGKFRKAEAELWAREEDKAFWYDAAAVDEDVDWKERQMLIPTGFKHMVQTLHASGKFCPFVATMLMGWLGEDGKVELEWAEAVPEEIRVRQTFEKQYPQLWQDSINSMYSWAQKPLQDYEAARNEVDCVVAPTFPLSAESLDDMTPNGVAQAVTSFLVNSYQTAFGSEEIPWEAVATAPNDYYDTSKSDIRFDPHGLSGLQRTAWHELAAALAAAAGDGTSGFFRKPAAAVAAAAEEDRLKREAADRLKRQQSDAAAEEERLKRVQADAVAEEERLKRVQADAAAEEERLKREQADAAAEEERLKRVQADEAAEEERLKREQSDAAAEEEHLKRVQADAAAEEERLKREQSDAAAEEEHLKRVQADAAAEEERLKRVQAAAASVQTEEEGASGAKGEKSAPKKSGRKRKAETQLVPEGNAAVLDNGAASTRPKRSRKTPQEAADDLHRRVAAEIHAAGKPGWKMVAVPPVPVEEKAGKDKRAKSSSGYIVNMGRLYTTWS